MSHTPHTLMGAQSVINCSIYTNKRRIEWIYSEVNTKKNVAQKTFRQIRLHPFLSFSSSTLIAHACLLEGLIKNIYHPVEFQYIIETPISADLAMLESADSKWHATEYCQESILSMKYTFRLLFSPSFPIISAVPVVIRFAIQSADFLR